MIVAFQIDDSWSQNRIRIGFDAKGNPHSVAYKEESSAGKNTKLELVCCKSTQETLNLSKEQIASVEKLRKDKIQILSNYFIEVNKAGSQKFRAEVHSATKESLEQIEQDLEHLLFPFQREKLFEIRNWLFVRQYGIVEFLKRFRSELEIELPGNLDDIHQRDTRLRKELLEAGIAEAKKRHDLLCKEILIKKVDVASIKPVVVDLLIENLERLDQIGRSSHQLKESLSSLEWYELGADGLWVHKKRDQLVATNSLRVLLQSVRKEEESSDIRILGLFPDQITSLRQIEHDFDIAYREVEDTLNQSIESGEKSVVAGRRFRKTISELDEKTFKLIQEKVFLPFQMEFFEEEMQKRQLQKFGAFGIFFYDVSSDMPKKKRLQAIKKQVRKLQAEIEELERQRVAKSAELLPEGIRQKVSRAIGDRPDYLRPSLVLLTDFDDGDN